MGLSPRKLNDYTKGLLRGLGINPERNQSPVARSTIEQRRIPTERLIARLGLSDYVFHIEPKLVDGLEEKEVVVPVGQHIGKPASPVVKVGDYVNAGDLIAEAAEGLSANIHTGFAGTVTEIGPAGIRITKKEA